MAAVCAGVVGEIPGREDARTSPDPRERADAPRDGEDVATSGRLRAPGLDEADCHWAVAMHVSTLASTVFFPLLALPAVIWWVRRRSPFNDDHGREIINAILSYVLLSILLLPTIVLPLVLAAVALVNVVRGAIAASRGEYFRYPMTFRFVR